MKVRVRFAPSPTGDPHIGSLRTALFNWLFAKKNKGSFILRIEDTDQQRYDQESLNSIIESLQWLGLKWDEGPYFQSERGELYKKYAQELIRRKKAYYCFCSKGRLEKLRIEQAEKKIPPHYDKLCLKLSEDKIKENLKLKKPYVIRLNIKSQGLTEFNDELRGKVIFENRFLDDPIILKTDGFPTYHLANVIDDHLMNISHVIRAEEWLPSTPKHVVLYQALDFKIPKFVHLPLILSRDRKKLSKRHGSVSILNYKKNGYLAEAVINFLAFLGWNPKTDQEFFSREELIREFSLDKINKSSAIFDFDKLNWLNGLYIRSMDIKELAERGNNYLKSEYYIKARKENIDLLKIWQMARERINNLKQINTLCDFIFEELDYYAEILIPIKGDQDKTAENLKLSKAFLKDFKGKFESSVLKKAFIKYIEANKLKTNDMLWPLRVALSGKRSSPDVFDILEMFNKQKSLKKIDQALEKLKNL